MIQQSEGGRIVNVTSIHEHIPLINGAAYAVSKAGLLDADARYGARVRRVRDNRQLRRTGPHRDPDDRRACDATVGHRPIGDPGRTSREPGGGCCRRSRDLCSASAGYVTGSSFSVDWRRPLVDRCRRSRAPRAPSIAHRGLADAECRMSRLPESENRIRRRHRVTGETITPPRRPAKPSASRPAQTPRPAGEARRRPQLSAQLAARWGCRPGSAPAGALQTRPAS